MKRKSSECMVLCPSVPGGPEPVRVEHEDSATTTARMRSWKLLASFHGCARALNIAAMIMTASPTGSVGRCRTVTIREEEDNGAQVLAAIRNEALRPYRRCEEAQP